jgi:hypothetical protein
VKSKRAYRKQAKQLARADAAYIAGYVDADGCLYARLHRGTVFASLEVSSVLPGTAAWFVSTTGVGSVRRIKSRTPNSKPQQMWRVSICSLDSLLSQLMPYLRGKRKQAELMLKLTAYAYPSRLEDEKQLQAISDFRVLNARGMQPLQVN